MNRRNTEPDHDDTRARILGGEETQIVLTHRLWHKGGQISTRAFVEVRFRKESGRWTTHPVLGLVANTDDGPDDTVNALGGLYRWLDNGRPDEVESSPPELAAALAAADAEAAK